MITESRIQQDIVMWFRNAYCTKLHSPQCKIFSVPNERSNVKEQMRMIATGLEKGVSDLIVIIPNKVLFVEVKTESGKQQKEQVFFQMAVEKLGLQYILVRSLEDFKNVINQQAHERHGAG